MKRFAILFTVALAITATTQAQTTEDSVKTTINRLFEGMKNADTVLLKSAFADDPILQTVATNKKKQVYIKSDKFKDFVKFIGDQKVGEADERIEFESIRIDGALAMVWAPYQFYYKGKFHHCGVNSFQLVKLDNNWKIQYLIDTRRKDCGISKKD
ncbi:MULTISPECIES: nuclear transport factor 2 family protein [Niastella]|uniref:Nuclear transport factor 2 family protein n=1 Tax=Niastella soli TaxID=2821487 RepID=A0ABS3YUU3_9BACT|nr:nuclear transport factor 2 family protein [Niastella soli]MBO9201660.1 nuclear transport factor 2 family protein [Niastella soli]